MLKNFSLPCPIGLRVHVVKVFESGWRFVVHRRFNRHQSADQVALLLLLPTWTLERAAECSRVHELEREIARVVSVTLRVHFSFLVFPIESQL